MDLFQSATLLRVGKELELLKTERGQLLDLIHVALSLLRDPYLYTLEERLEMTQYVSDQSRAISIRKAVL